MTEFFKILTSLADVIPAQWNALCGTNPFTKHEFLHALHESGSASAGTGWAPRYVSLWRGDALLGAMPLYLKTHSYGEYIFDWAWADAYYRHGYRYYPKLLCAVPFTPAPGPRLLAPTAAIRAKLLKKALDLVDELSASSLHCLFAEKAQAEEMHRLGMMPRDSVQFQWENNGYATFSDFLAAMSHDKRKKINQERRKLSEQGIRFTRLLGKDITEAHWRFFLRCYRNTYRLHSSTAYLNLDFFLRVASSMPEHILLVVASAETEPIAASLFFYDEERLFGRYWGSVAYVPGLHFEACYYQGIEFCIDSKRGTFAAGVQGEHKLARGLLPVNTYSAHFLADVNFAAAIGDFLRRETRGIDRYINELGENSPFKHRG